MEQFEQFIQQLRYPKLPESSQRCVFNPYDDSDPFNEKRRGNLLCYLRTIAENKPTLALIGEAPGYQGCARSGIPFTSNYVMAQALGCFNTEGFSLLGSEKEPTATIIWTLIAELCVDQALPLFWNAFPFHPHKINDPFSNRAPSKGESEIGGTFLKELLSLFPTITTVAAIGKQAGLSLTKLGIPHETCRHPSYGGKPEFETKLRSLLTDRS